MTEGWHREIVAYEQIGREVRKRRSATGAYYVVAGDAACGLPDEHRDPNLWEIW